MHIVTKFIAAILVIANLFVIVVAAPETVVEELPPTSSIVTDIQPETTSPTETIITTVPTITEPVVTEPVKTDWEIAVECASPYALGTNMKNMYFVTDVSIDELNMLLKGTRLEGAGEYFKRLEIEYGVNAVVAVAAGKLESQLGSTEIAYTYNNAFGFRTDKGWLSFNSLEDSVIYFGKLMQHERYFGKTLDEIAKIYCPNDIWCDKVSRIVDRYVGMIEDYREKQQ